MADASRNQCRHYLGLLPFGQKQCAMGRNIPEWVKRCNNGDTTGIFYKIPCTGTVSNEDAVFSCPELNRKTNQEIAAEREASQLHMAKILSGWTEVQNLKEKMIAKGVAVAKATCPWCKEKDQLLLNCNIKGNKHVRVKCQSCGEGFME